MAGCFAFQQEQAGIRTPRCFLLMLVGDQLLSFRLVKTGVTNLVSGELAAHGKAGERTTRRSAVITWKKSSLCLEKGGPNEVRAFFLPRASGSKPWRRKVQGGVQGFVEGALLASGTLGNTRPSRRRGWLPPFRRTCFLTPRVRETTLIYSCIAFPFFLILPGCGLFKAHAREREANESASLGSGFEQAPTS